MDAGESYKNFRKLGLSKDFARHMAMRGGWEEEREGLRTGVNDYSEEEMRLAVVHTRQDVTLVVSDLGEILKEQRKTNTRLNWLIFLAIIIAFVAGQN